MNATEATSPYQHENEKLLNFVNVKSARNRSTLSTIA
jgi:hypothetical protein